MSMIEKKRRIVVIDDSSDWMDALEALLREYGECREIQKCKRDEFLEKFKRPTDFDLVDYCFVDLELGVRTKKTRTDKYGLTQVLPRIRTVAPWVPAACVSVWITNDAKILHELSVSDFDGLYPKELIGEEDESTQKFCVGGGFNRELWSRILHDLGVKRIAALTGRTVADVRTLIDGADQVELVASSGAKKILEKLGESEVREAISALGLGAKKISISEIVTGFSGVYVVKAEAFGVEDGGAFRSKWLLKFGRATAKLAREAYAHRRMFGRGLDRHLIVGQLYPNPVFWKGIGIIAYGYEEQTKTALELAREQGLGPLMNSLAPVARALYSSPEKCPCDMGKEVKRWVGRGDQIGKIVESTEQPMVLSRSIIHGDLHLRNILVSNGMATLIDFARSEVGPIAVDAAKFVADTLVFAKPEELQGLKIVWEELEHSAVQDAISLFKEYLPAEDDRNAFCHFLTAYLLRYASYEDVPEDRRQVLKAFATATGS